MLQLRTLSFIGLFCLAAGSSPAQNAFLLDLFSASNTVLTSMTLANDERVFLVNTDNGRVLWKGSPSGDPIWAKEMPESPWQSDIQPRDNGGLYVVSAYSVQIGTNLPSTADDTLSEHLSVRALNGDGTLLWARDLELTQLMPYESDLHLDAVRALRMPDGSLKVALHLSGQTFADMLHVFHFSPTGDLVSSKTYGTELWPDFPIGLFGSSTEYDITDPTWTATPNGWSYLSSVPMSSPSGYNIIFGFDSDGDMAWAKKFKYINNITAFKRSNPIALSSGDLLFGLACSISGSPSLITWRTNNGGDLLDHDLYQGMSSTFTFRLTPGQNDERMMLSQNVSDPHVIQVDAAGEVIEAWRAPNFSAPPFDFAVLASTATPDPTGARVNLSLIRQHQVFGYVNRFVGSTVVAPADPGCLFEPVSINHYEIPDSLVVVDTIGVVQTFPLIPVVNIGSDLVDISPLVTSDLCSQLVGVHENAPQNFTVVNSIAHGGLPIAVIIERPLSLHLIAPNGTLASAVITAPASGRVLIPVEGLAPGLYVLKAFELSGEPSGIAKVVIN